MLDILLVKIPKGVNELLFAFGCLGLIIPFNKKIKPCIVKKCIAVLIVIMMLWRVGIQIRSSRYVIILIYPFSILAATLTYYTFFQTENKGKYIAKVLLGIATVISLVLWIQKNYKVSQISNNLYAISDTIKRYDKNEEQLTFIVDYDDYPRIKQRTMLNNVIKKTEGFATKGLKQAYSQINRDGINPVIETVSPKSDIQNITNGLPSKKYKHILSAFTQKSKKKRHDLFVLETDSFLSLISKTNIYTPQDNILLNGDMELWDSSENSFNKMKRISRYNDYHDRTEDIKTPQNAYFFYKEPATPTFPVFKSIDQDAITGNYSVSMTTLRDYAYIFFEQKFKDKSDYTFSAVIRGKPQSFVCIFCYSYHDNTCDANQLCVFTIPDTKLYKLTGNFSFEPVNCDAYFKVGAWIQRGEVTMDNFVLQKKSQ